MRKLFAKFKNPKANIVSIYWKAESIVIDTTYGPAVVQRPGTTSITMASPRVTLSFEAKNMKEAEIIKLIDAINRALPSPVILGAKKRKPVKNE